MTTIREILQVSAQPAGWARHAAQSTAFESVRRRVEDEMQGRPLPPGFFEMLAAELPGLLEIDIGDLLVWGWRKRQEIIQYRDTEKFPPGETYLVPLLEHTVTSRHRATIEPRINATPLGELVFDITLKLQLEGAVLKIRAAQVEEVAYGRCLAAGAVAFAGVNLIERKTAPYELPTVYRPDPAITI